MVVGQRAPAAIRPQFAGAIRVSGITLLLVSLFDLPGGVPPVITLDRSSADTIPWHLAMGQGGASDEIQQNKLHILKSCGHEVRRAHQTESVMQILAISVLRLCPILYLWTEASSHHPAPHRGLLPDRRMIPR